MIKIAVIYFSQSGNTKHLAQAIISGIKSTPDVQVITHQISGKEIIEGRFKNTSLFETLKDCDGIVMGSPTYMGGVAAQFKAFADASSDYWSEQAWSNKVAAGFTCGSALNGDQSMSLQYLFTLASQHGMYWVGLDTPQLGDHQTLNPLGCQLGLVAQAKSTGINEDYLATAFYLGQRVANLALRLKE